MNKTRDHNKMEVNFILNICLEYLKLIDKAII